MKKIIEGLGFEYRPEQAELIEEVRKAFSETDDVIVEAPTGWGKSLIAAVLGSIYGDAYISSSEKLLQRQYLKDFKHFIDLMGKSNYQCAVDQFMTVEEAPCSLFPSLSCKEFCTYYANKRTACNKRCIVLTNHHFLAVEFDFVKMLPSKDLAVFDEAHVLEPLLSDYAAFRLDSSLTRILEALAAASSHVFEDYADATRRLAAEANAWLFDAEEVPEEEVEEILVGIYSKLHLLVQAHKNALKQMFGGASPEVLVKSLPKHPSGQHILKTIKLLKTLERFCCKHSNFIDFRKKVQWVPDATEKSLAMYPLEVSFYTKKILQSAGRKRLYMSATIGDPETFARSLGLEKYAFISKPSVFPKENRRLYLTPRGKVNYEFVQSEKMKELAEETAKLAEALSAKHGNGVIFAGSYRIARIVKEALEERGLDFCYHASAEERETAVSKFLENGGILLTGSIYQGLDLKDDLSRWQIIVKVPFMSLQSKLVRKKLEFNKDWYLHQAALKVAQSYGRSVRSKKDFCITYVLDSLFFSIKKYLPKYVREACFLKRA